MGRLPSTLAFTTVAAGSFMRGSLLSAALSLRSCLVLACRLWRVAGVRGVEQLQTPVTSQLHNGSCCSEGAGISMSVRAQKRTTDAIPCSESEPSDIATDVPMVCGKPLGNAALAGTFFAPIETKPERDLIIQHQ